MKPDLKFKFGKRKKLASVLGLALDGSRLDGAVLKRTNGSLQQLQMFTATLALDPLTAAPELVGREIRNQLDAAGVRERNCVLGVPLKWVLTAQTELPPLPEADAASLLQLEAERNFHADAATLQIGDSRTPLAGDKKFVLLAGVPQPHVGTLEQVLAAAKLKPASFGLGIAALQYARGNPSDGVLALVIGETHVGLEITCGGVVTLRALDGTVESVSGRPQLHPEVVAREARITLGQLPAELRAAVKHIRIFGPRDLALALQDELELKFAPAGLAVEAVTAVAADEFGVTLPANAPVSAAFSLAARALVEQKPPFEFLPPKPGLVERLMAKYSSGRLQMIGAIGAAVGVLFLGAFGWQQIRLWHLRSEWSKIQTQVGELEGVQDNIREYRSWYDGTFKNLAILRQLTLAFPEDGSVTAKNIAIRHGSQVTCSGTARDYAALLGVQAKLRAADGVSDVKLEQIRGKAPMQFVFGFNLGNGGGNEN
jgi:hypothetical protein